MRLLIMPVLVGCATGWEDLPAAPPQTDPSHPCVVAEVSDLQLRSVPIDLLGGSMSVPVRLQNTCEHAVDGTLSAELVDARRSATLSPGSLRLPARAEHTVILVPSTELAVGLHQFDVNFTGQSEPLFSVELEVSSWPFTTHASPAELRVPDDCAVNIDLVMRGGIVPFEISDLDVDAPPEWTVDADPVPVLLDHLAELEVSLQRAPGHSRSGETDEVRLVAVMTEPERHLHWLDLEVEQGPGLSPRVVFEWPAAAWAHPVRLPMAIEEGSAYVLGDRDAFVAWDDTLGALTLSRVALDGSAWIRIAATPKCLEP